jgi:dipeptidyl aminopeptidase/acylaminoacyl peptidase
MSGNGKMLVFADITNDEDEDTLYPGVYRMIGRNAEHVTRTRYAMSVGVGGSHFALARFKPAGCICNSDPAWSPDGARIAFVSGRTGDEPQLLVINADGTNSKAVIDGATAFVWSPDGRSFAVDQQDRVVIVKVGGAGVRTVDRNPCYCELAWAPDGRHLAYVRYVRGNEHLFVYAVKKGKTDDLGRGHSPRWSPDSRRIAYTRNVSGGGDRVFVGAVSGRRSNVDLGSGADPAWAPDGSALALQRQDGTYAIAPDGSATRRLGPSGVISPDWRWIAYEADPPDQTLWLVSTSGGTPRKLSEGVAGGGWQWSPDSRSIAFAESSLSVGIVDVETGAHRTSASGVDCSSPNWSADSTRMVCPAPQGTFTDVDLPESELAVVDARSGAIATVTHTLPEPQRMIIELYTAAGKLLSSFAGPQELTGIAWGGSRYALLVPRSTTQATIEIRSASGELLRSVSVPRPWFDELSMSGRWIVFRAGQTVRLLDALTGRAAVLARTRKSSIVGLSIDGRRIAWAESGYRQSRIRAVLLSGS